MFKFIIKTNLVIFRLVFKEIYTVWHYFSSKGFIDTNAIIYIFKAVFISSFNKIILIKNGVGNRPADAVATDPDFVRMTGAKSCSASGGER
jgi:hypothetical protein